MITFSLTTAESLYGSEEQFPVDFDLAWQWLGYSEKSKGKRSLMSRGFEEGVDFELAISGELRPQGGYSDRERISLTVDCLKNWAMMSGTSQGKEVRQYFLQCEKLAKKLSAQIQPDVLTSPGIEAAKRIAEIYKILKADSPEIADKIAKIECNRFVKEQELGADQPQVAPSTSLTKQTLSKAKIAASTGKSPKEVIREMRDPYFEDCYLPALNREIAKLCRVRGIDILDTVTRSSVYQRADQGTIIDAYDIMIRQRLM